MCDPKGIIITIIIIQPLPAIIIVITVTPNALQRMFLKFPQRTKQILESAREGEA